MDKATSYTLQLFDALETYLHIEWDEMGEPVGYPSRINHITIQRLVLALKELYEKNAILDAISGFEGYSGHQSSAVGFAENYDAFIKVGVLLGDRIVLWEAILISELDSNILRADRVLKAACDILRMKPLVEQGGAVYLPHMRNWNPNYYSYMQDFAQENVSNELLGLINAMVIWQDFKVGSFSWQPDFSTIQELDLSINKQNAKTEKHELIYALQGLIHNTESMYLRDVSLAEFYENTRNKQFRKELRTSLMAVKDCFEVDDDTNARKDAIDNLVRDIANGLESQRKAVKKYWITRISSGAGIGAGGIGVARHSVAAIIDGPSALTFLALLGGALAAGSASWRFVKNAFERSKEALIYQVFSSLEKAAERRYIEEFEKAIV